MTSTLVPRHVAPPSAVGSDRVRLDIQGLRALAVALVVVFHLFPGTVTGGYVGVDVFFVISGFLITSHLMREVAATGRVSLPRFWARRARRLLPASLAVLGAVLIGIAWWVPKALWDQFIREVIASAAYVENLALAADSVDYLASDNAASPVQHYWSLAAEEQFYLVWPLLIVLAVALGARAGWRRRTAAVLLVVTVASFASSLWWTAAQPAQAYFVTPTRAWEFGAGALLALVPVAVGHAYVRAFAAWTGVALIGASAVLLDAATPFPGAWALLPVAGTVAVLWADADGVPGSPTSIARVRPVQTVGELSYSIYLWHWPLIVLAPFVLGHDLGRFDKLALVPLIGALAYASWRWIENPARRSRLLTTRRPRLTFVLTVAGMAAVIGAGVAMTAVVDREVDASLAEAERLAAVSSVEDASGDDAGAVAPVEPPVCIGAATRDPDRPCEPTLAPGEVVPVPAAARLDSPEDCLGDKGTRQFEPCEFGVPLESARGTVALIGDSHAYHWLPAIEDLANAHGWHGIVMTRASCPFTEAQRNLEARLTETCAWHNAQVSATLEERQDITLVVMAEMHWTRFAAPDGVDERTFAQDSFRDAIDSVPDRVTDVYVIRDAPRPLPDNVECVEQELSDGSTTPGDACAVPRADALGDDALARAAATSPRGAVVDLSDVYCEDGMCPPVVGNVMVFADQGHLTRTWVHSTVPQLERAMTGFAR
ncbi:acyltransferase family protein [Demequina gelatinilytica]|uniref:acyltransferase family protein n=1 Tax=Demequina gelatinilytica TaxID=1638980 RepID=UPI0007867203|nr:acyltransferase family protein [Demequina gelatinilytica]